MEYKRLRLKILTVLHLLTSSSRKGVEREHGTHASLFPLRNRPRPTDQPLNTTARRVHSMAKGCLRYSQEPIRCPSSRRQGDATGDAELPEAQNHPGWSTLLISHLHHMVADSLYCQSCNSPVTTLAKTPAGTLPCMVMLDDAQMKWLPSRPVPPAPGSRCSTRPLSSGSGRDPSSRARWAHRSSERRMSCYSRDRCLHSQYNAVYRFHSFWFWCGPSNFPIWRRRQLGHWDWMYAMWVLVSRLLGLC